MKTTFKTCLVAIALLIGINTYAQDKPITFGVKAGVNLSNASGSDVVGNKAKIGFNAGVTLDYGFTSDVYLLTGLEFTTKGYKVNLKGEDDNYKMTSNMMFLQLPVHVGYKLSVAEDTKVVFHAGPYIAYGIGGKTTDNEDDKWDSFGDEAAKRFDFGVGVGAGLEFGKIGVGLGWDFGLANLSRGEGKARTQNGYLSVGYKF